jgi:DNA primase
MAGRIPPEFVDELLARTDIVDLINHRVPLRKAGKDYQACCPFHDEKTPSFTVSREKQFYHCFGCGAHGSAIGFLMEYEHQAFPEAVEELARQAGMEIPRGGSPVRTGPDPRPLHALMEEAATIYRQQLRRHPSASTAVAYLKGRGLTGEIAASFGIGYAPPGWDFLLGRLGKDDASRQRLVQCGLVIEQEGRRYDRFRERIMFPIRDRRGRVIGFGGRLLGDGKPKYLNSPETPIFHKGRELYGLFEALQANRRLERLLVVEGYMDVVALAQFGITYGVATLGTATTADHLRQLLPQAPELVFCFDGDAAGREAGWKALETTLHQATGQQEIRFLFLPEGEDPDTLVRSEGRNAFEDRVRQATPLSDFLFERLTSQVDMNSLDGKARLAILARPLLTRAPNGLYRDMLEGRLASLVGVAASELGQTGTERRTGSQRPARRPSASSPGTTPLRLAIALILQHPRLAPAALTVANDWRNIDNPGVALLSQLLDLVSAYPEISSGALMERWRDRPELHYLQQLADPRLLDHIPDGGFEAELTAKLARLNQDAAATRTGNLFERGSPRDWTEAEKAMLRGTGAPQERRGD